MNGGRAAVGVIGLDNDRRDGPLLTPEQQRLWIKAEPDVVEPFRGAWGRRGCTKVNFDMATPDVLDSALVAAWRNVAPKRLVQEFEAE